MKLIIGRFYAAISQPQRSGSRKIRIPEFHKNGKKNINFDYYKKLIGVGKNSLKIIDVR